MSESLAHYERLVATIPGLERKGKQMPYTSLNGHMFSFLTQAGRLALRLPVGERERFLDKHGARLCEQHGSVLKEYVEVPDALLADTKALKKYFAASHAFAAALPPKSTGAAGKRASAGGAASPRPRKKKGG